MPIVLMDFFDSPHSQPHQSPSFNCDHLERSLFLRHSIYDLVDRGEIIHKNLSPLGWGFTSDVRRLGEKKAKRISQ